MGGVILFRVTPSVTLSLSLSLSLSQYIYIRAIHGSGELGFCLTHNQLVEVRVGYFSTHNRPVIAMDLLVQVAGWRPSVSGEPDIHRCPVKRW